MPRSHTLVPRPALDLELEAGLTPTTVALRIQLFSACQSFVLEHTGIHIDQLALSGVLLGYTLAAYRKHLFASNAAH